VIVARDFMAQKKVESGCEGAVDATEAYEMTPLRPQQR
jgi:hypothetical protein